LNGIFYKKREWVSSKKRSVTEKPGPVRRNSFDTMGHDGVLLKQVPREDWHNDKKFDLEKGESRTNIAVIRILRGNKRLNHKTMD